MIRSSHALTTAAVAVIVAALAACGAADGADGPSAPSPESSPPNAVTASSVAPTTAAPATVPAATNAPSADSTTSSSPSTTATTTTAATTSTTTTTTTIPEPVVRSGAEVGPSTAVEDPTAIRIPSIGVESALVATGVLDDGTVAVPPDANVAGWFDKGPRPGERGPSLIMGHVDSARTGPGVFYELRNLQVGAIVTVDNPAGSLDFVVDRVEQHAKLDFPTEAVYGPSPSSALRLVTCGGSFDRSARSYYDNIIVYLNPVTP